MKLIEKKKKVLAYSDAVTVCTGFGIVSKYILTALYKTGLYEIEHLAINYHGDFVNKEECPWQMVPAKLLDPSDPYGAKMFLKNVAERDYDIVWILNDTHVTNRLVVDLQEIFDKRTNKGKKNPVVIYYYPVDCHVQPEYSAMIKFADILVAYNDHGIEETLKTFPELSGNLNKIHHGTNTASYRPLDPRLIPALKQKYFNVKEDTFIVMNVNRNSVRKQITRTLLAFAEFKKQVPNSLLYLHTNPREVKQNIDLLSCINDLNIKRTDVVFPPNYSPSTNTLSEGVLNEVYNCADLFITTTLGEGWGLSITDAMAAGVPVVAPDNTCIPILLGQDRGYIYPCKEKIWVDGSGFRPLGLTTDVVEQMMQVYKAGFKYSNQRVVNARKWVLENDWSSICQQWVALFEQASLYTKEKKTKNTFIEEL